jgi:hypothetical protein
VARFGDPEALALTWSSRLRLRPSASRFIRDLNPRLVLWPTTIANPIDFDLVSAATRADIPVVMSEGSFDNLVAKGAIWPRPRRLLVWGEFSRAYARAEHGFADDAIDVTGPPHFGVYRRVQDLTPRSEWFARHQLDPRKRLIYVAGTTIGRRGEPALLRTLSARIDEGKLPDAYLWYRPHPRAARRVNRDELDAIPRVIVDPGVDPDVKDWVGHIDRRDPRQRADTLAACDVVVSVFSTVVLEAALVGKPAILIDVPSLGGPEGAMRSYQEFGHLQRMRECPWVKLAPDRETVVSLLNEFLRLDPASMQAPLRALGEHFVYCGGADTPQDRIGRALEECLA